MQGTVHILNGDSTSFGIQEGGLTGDLIIWREMLVDGPLEFEVGSDEFWKKRYAFFENEFAVSKIEYFDTTIKELIKIESLSAYREVVLWFEYDLFCQVNLIALCSYLLKHYRKDIIYYLVCTGKEQGKEGLQTLADYPPEAYRSLYENRVKLSRNDLLFAEKAWGNFVSGNLAQLKTFDFDRNKKFKYLKKAIEQHFKRLPGPKGLNQIEIKILQLVDQGMTGEKKLISELLTWQRKETVYGFGDLQYFCTLRKLSPFFEPGLEEYILNNKGKAMLDENNS